MPQPKPERGRKSVPQPDSILLEAHQLIFGDRREEYGHPLDDYTRTAGMVNACFDHVLKRPLTPEEVMTIMILVKVSRYQETAKRDTLVDMAGYCGTIGEAQAERLKRTKADANLKEIQVRNMRARASDR